MKIKFILTPLFILLLIIGNDTLAQKKKKGEEKLEVPTFTMENGKVIYTEVVDVSGTTNKVLYDRCLGWFNGFYKNPTNVIKEKVAEQKIVGKGNFTLYLEDEKSGAKSRSGLMQYTIEVSFKEGRYKYDITKINKKEQSYYGIEKLIAANEKEYKYAYASYLIQTEKEIKDLIANLKKVMQSTGETKKSDW